MKPISPFGLPLGISIVVWGFIGMLRLISERFIRVKKRKKSHTKFKPSDIAVLVPAHNEEPVITECIQAIKTQLSPKQIYVISDGSTDKTYEKAKREGCHVSRLTPGRGKAKALVYLLKHYCIFNKYKLIFTVDADTEIDKHFVKRALMLFDDPEIAVVFGTARIHWPEHIIPKLSIYFIAYRERLNKMLQYFLIYGQTWKYTNVNYVIPGFANIYKSEILKQLEIDTPGLLIEDFNLAFQVHRKKLGKIGYNLGLIGWDQHPDNLDDYWKQVKRWNIGFFQTVKKNGVWPSFFWLALGVFSAEIILQSLFLLVLPIHIFFLILPSFAYIHPMLKTVSLGYNQITPFSYLHLADIYIGVFLFDYLVTLAIGWINKKPQFTFYGLFFFFMHYVTSLILVASIIPGFFSQSSGRWISPKRQPL